MRPPATPGAFVLWGTLACCKETHSLEAQFGPTAQTARCIWMLLCALSDAVSLDSTRQIHFAPANKCTRHTNHVDFSRVQAILGHRHRPAPFREVRGNRFDGISSDHNALDLGRDRRPRHPPFGPAKALHREPQRWVSAQEPCRWMVSGHYGRASPSRDHCLGTDGACDATAHQHGHISTDRAAAAHQPPDTSPHRDHHSDPASHSSTPAGSRAGMVAPRTPGRGIRHRAS